VAGFSLLQAACVLFPPPVHLGGLIGLTRSYHISFVEY